MAGRGVSEEQDRIDMESSCSDSGSVTDGDGPVCEGRNGFPGDGMIRLEEEDEEYTLLKHRLYTNIGPLARCCHIVSICRNTHSTATGRARLGTFQLHLKAMAEKRDGNPNVRYGWYGTSRDRVHRIVNDGFGICGMPEDGGGSFGFGLYLSQERSAVESVLSSNADEYGLRHLVFCRIILGNTEELLPSSRQFCPSSDQFDSGVVSQQSPMKYIVWYPDVNTHVLPLYVLTVKLDSHPRGLQKESVKRPSSPWIPFRSLVSMLSCSLPPSTMCLIRKLHNDFMEKKITRQQFVLRVRELSGDGLLISAIKSFRDKANSSRNCFLTGNGSRTKTRMVI